MPGPLVSYFSNDITAIMAGQNLLAALRADRVIE